MLERHTSDRDHHQHSKNKQSVGKITQASQIDQEKHQRIKQSNSIKWKSHSRKNTHLNVFEGRRIKLQNQRLIKRLSEIDKRKNIMRMKNYQSEYSMVINMKSREAYRQQRQKSIQEENNSFVERIVRNLSHSKGVIHENFSHSVSRDKKRAKKRVQKDKNQYGLPVVSVLQNRVG